MGYPRVGWQRHVPQQTHPSVASWGHCGLLSWGPWQRNCPVWAWSLAHKEVGPGKWDSVPIPCPGTSSLKAHLRKCPWLPSAGVWGRGHEPQGRRMGPELAWSPGRTDLVRAVGGGARAQPLRGGQKGTGRSHFLKHLVCYKVKEWP